MKTRLSPEGRARIVRAARKRWKDYRKANANGAYDAKVRLVDPPKLHKLVQPPTMLAPGGSRVHSLFERILYEVIAARVDRELGGGE